VRFLSQFAVMGTAFYSVYAVSHFSLKAITAGILTSVFLISQIIANPLMGWLGDRWGHKRVMILGMVAALASAVLAWQARSLAWFYPVFILAGPANVALWTTALVMTVDFGPQDKRPTYIGLSNTLVAPATILAPILGGLIADVVNYQTTFLVSAIGGLLTVIVLYLLVKDPEKKD